MARYLREELLNQPDEFVNFMMNDFLTKHGFTYVEHKGEMVYRGGGDWFDIPRFLKWSYYNGGIHIEAWTYTVWLPGVYGKENPLKGYYGCVYKSAFKKDIEELIALLHQNVTPQTYTQANPSVAQAPINPTPIVVQGVDMSRYATMGLVFSILSFLGICIPLVGVIFGTTGIIMSSKAKRGTPSSKANAAFVVSIIGLVLSVCVWLLNLFLNVLI